MYLSTYLFTYLPSYYTYLHYNKMRPYTPSDIIGPT
jgi:hypothetical protein